MGAVRSDEPSPSDGLPRCRQTPGTHVFAPTITVPITAITITTITIGSSEDISSFFRAFAVLYTCNFLAYLSFCGDNVMPANLCLGARLNLESSR